MQRFELLRPQTHLLGRLHEEMGRIFSEVFGDSHRAPRSPLNGFFAERSFPPLNLWEDEDSLYASCELPGVKLEDIEVLVKGRELTVKGERKPTENDQFAFHRRERAFGSFRRVVHLSKDIDADKVSASLKDGVLTLTLPKAQTARARKVEVKCLKG